MLNGPSDAETVLVRSVGAGFLLCAGLPTPHRTRLIGRQIPGDLRSAVSARSGDLRSAVGGAAPRDAGQRQRQKARQQQHEIEQFLHVPAEERQRQDQGRSHNATALPGAKPLATQERPGDPGHQTDRVVMSLARVSDVIRPAMKAIPANAPADQAKPYRRHNRYVPKPASQ